MKISDIAFTAYPVADMARARGFYEGLLGLAAARTWGPAEKPVWVEYDIGAGCLALIDGEGLWHAADGGPAIALEVADYEEVVARLKAAGISFVVEPQEHQTCRMALVRDTEGNRLLFHNHKHAAPTVPQQA